MQIDDRISTVLKPDYYDIIPSYSKSELEKRLNEFPFHIATLLNLKNIRRAISYEKGKKGLSQFLGSSFELQRKFLCEVLEYRGFSSIVVSAFKKIKREIFVLEPYRKYSYLDAYIPFTRLSCLSNPTIVAIMIEKLRANAGNRILEIGIGSGYHACCLMESFKGECELVGVEVNRDYYEFGLKAIKEMGYSGIEFYFGSEIDLMNQRIRQFDRIYTATAFTEIPSHIIDLLSVGGIFQGTRPLTRFEFESESTNAWIRRTYKSYDDYKSTDWFQNFACLSVYQNDGTNLREIDTVYDVAFVPYRTSSEIEIYETITSLISDLEV